MSCIINGQRLHLEEYVQLFNNHFQLYSPKSYNYQSAWKVLFLLLGFGIHKFHVTNHMCKNLLYESLCYANSEERTEISEQKVYS